MAGMTDYLETLILNLIFRTQAATKPAAIYVGLFTATPSDTGGGTEVTGGSYARVAVTQADAQWNAPTVGGLTDNVNDITFPAATGSWGTVTHVGIFDASTSGNLLMWAALTASKVVASGDVFKFSAGALDITLD